MPSDIVQRIRHAAVTLRPYHKNGHGVDESGWAIAVVSNMARPVGKALEQEWKALVRHVATECIKQLARQTRPSAAKVERTIQAQVANGQITLPEYAEFYQELYRPNGTGAPVAGPALHVGEAYQCAMAGIALGRNTITKHERLLAVVKLAQQRGYADQDYLSKLWGYTTPIAV